MPAGEADSACLGKGFPVGERSCHTEPANITNIGRGGGVTADSTDVRRRGGSSVGSLMPAGPMAWLSRTHSLDTQAHWRGET